MHFWLWNEGKLCFQAYLRRQKKEAYNNGFNYAAGALLRGEETPISLESFFYRESLDPFNHGVIDAIEQLISLKVISDDRIEFNP